MPRLIPALLLALAVPALAQAPDPRIAVEIESALVRLHETGAFDAAEGGELEIERAPRTRYELGAVVDTAASGRGLPVLAVTPGGAAERIGLRVGDRLLRVNDYSLAALDEPGAGLFDAIESAGGRLDLTVARAGDEVQLSGQAQATEVPGYRLRVTAPPRGCGRIDMSLRPPVTQGLHPVVLHEIDGRLPGPLESESFHLSTGKHTLKLSEAIESRFLSLNQNRKRGTQFRSERFKYLELDVQPDTTYRIGARLVKENADDIHGGGYWEPVVWSTVTVPCR